MTPDKPWLKPGAVVKLRDGSKARIYAVDGAATSTHGAIWEPSMGWALFSWYSDGSARATGPDDYDIISEWKDPEPKRPRLLAYRCIDTEQRIFYMGVRWMPELEKIPNCIGSDAPALERIPWLDEPEEPAQK